MSWRSRVRAHPRLPAPTLTPAPAEAQLAAKAQAEKATQAEKDSYASSATERSDGAMHSFQSTRGVVSNNDPSGNGVGANGYVSTVNQQQQKKLAACAPARIGLDIDSTRSGAQERARVKAHGVVTVKDEQRTGICWIEEGLGDESIARMGGSFGRITPVLDEVWLRDTLWHLQQVCGNVPIPEVRRVIRASFDVCSRRLPIPYGEKGHVAFPREFARRAVMSEMARQNGIR